MGMGGGAVPSQHLVLKTLIVLQAHRGRAHVMDAGARVMVSLLPHVDRNLIPALQMMMHG